MRLVNFALGADSRMRPGLVLDDETVLDLEQAAEHVVRVRAGLPPDHASSPHWWITEPGRAATQVLRKELARHKDNDLADAVLRADEIVYGPPVTRPGKILAAGRNYGSHLRASASRWAERGREVKRPSMPVGFAKFPSSLVGHGSAIIIPEDFDGIDYELELAVVIGRRCIRVPLEDALAHVAGYTVVNDLSARNLQIQEMELLGILLSKNFPTFAPMGPHLVTADEIADPQNLDIELRVDGEVRQRANTSDMLFSVAELVSWFSAVGLDPGDVIFTGTPTGVASDHPDPTPYFLKPGQEVEGWIASIGTLRNPVVAASAKHRPQ